MDTNNPLRNVRLYGKLGARFGRTHRLAVKTPAEAVRALGVLLPGFQKELVDSGSKGIAYAVFVGKRNIGESELAMPGGIENIRIAPILAGSKSGGFFQTVLGVVLVTGAAIASVASGGTALGAFAAGGLTGTAATLGTALALGGVAQMLTPQQKALSTNDAPDNGASYNFNGPVNTVAQGNPVPVLYGEMFVGSVVISAGIYSEDKV